jgi:hypothetical protein
MAKKIVVDLRDTFAPGEFPRLSSLLIQTLRAEFPGFIVHTNVRPKYREAFTVSAFGLWNDGDTDVILTAACKTVERLLMNVGWRNENQSTPSPIEKVLVASNDVVDEDSVEDSEDSVDDSETRE